MQEIDQEELQTLLLSLINDTITDKESVRFSLLINDPENKEAVCKSISELRTFKNNNGDSARSVDFNSIYSKIVSSIHPEEETTTPVISKNTSRFRILLAKISAAAAIIIIAVWTGTLSRRIIPIKPAAADNKIAYYNEIKTPLGSKTNITLPDGSIVYLNSGSVIRYPDNFNIQNRDISLEGEAYFTVAPKKDLPFIVTADNINIRATGTEFNVKAYAEDNYVEATLVKGKIEISQQGITDESADPFQLQPSQKAAFLKTTGKLKDSSGLHGNNGSEIKEQDLVITSSVDVDQVVSWTKNRFVFNNERLEDLSIKISRAYDVTISFGDEESKEYRFSGTLEDNPIEQILTAIKLTSPVDYRIEGRNVTLLTDKHRHTMFR